MFLRIHLLFRFCVCVFFHYQSQRLYNETIIKPYYNMVKFIKASLLQPRSLGFRTFKCELPHITEYSFQEAIAIHSGKRINNTTFIINETQTKWESSTISNCTAIVCLVFNKGVQIEAQHTKTGAVMTIQDCQIKYIKDSMTLIISGHSYRQNPGAKIAHAAH